MDRRSFVRRAAAGAALGAAATAAGCVRKPVSTTLAGTGGLSAGPAVEWILASSFSRSVDVIFGASEVLSKRVAQLTGGRFVIRVKQAGEHVGPLQVLDAVQSGSAQMGHTAGYYYTGKHPALAFDTAVPFGLTCRQQFAWMNQAGGMDLLRKVWGQFNVHNLPGGNTGVQMGGWFRKEVNNLADLKGLIMRIPGMGGEVMNRMGVAAKVLGVADIYPSLERGAIDAAEWVGPYDDEKLSLHKVAKFYYYPGWWEPGPALTFIIHKPEWDKLPADYREALTVASAEASLDMVAKYDARNPIALESLLKQGVILRKYPQDILDAARKHSDDLHHEFAAKDPLCGEVYAHWSAFKKASDRWFSSSEHTYDRLADATAAPLTN